MWQECQASCLKTYQACNQSLSFAVEMNEQADFIADLMICARFCELTAQALALKCEFSFSLCQMCAELCEAIAEVSDGFEEDELRACGPVCAENAKLCRAWARKQDQELAPLMTHKDLN